VGTPATPFPEITEETIRTWPRVRFLTSAGGVAYRRDPVSGEWELALIATKGGTRWQLPKGSRLVHESPVETALREVEEEVGLRTAQEAFLKQVTFWYWDSFRKEVPDLVQKAVDYYLLRVEGGVLSDASCEVDGVAWFTFDQAATILTYAGDREVVQLAWSRLEPKHP
jgi:8-oxo-dGTP pyrophosphatase MutT (NUDIX family)